MVWVSQTQTELHNVSVCVMELPSNHSFGCFVTEVMGSDEDLHHVVVHFLLGGRDWKRGVLLWVGLDGESPLQGAAVKHWHICTEVTDNVKEMLKKKEIYQP